MKAQRILSAPSQSLVNKRQILGTPRRNEPRTALARTRARCSKRAKCFLRFRLVYEGFDARDLKEAKALLQELAA